MKFKVLFKTVAVVATLFLSVSPAMAGGKTGNEEVKSLRKERGFIREGNSLYEKGRYREAARKYSEAVDINPESAVGRYNLGLAQIRQCNPTDTTAANQKLMQIGVSNLQAAASTGLRNVRVSTLACYNLGNLAFNQQKYDEAIQYYKQALRLNPADDNARRNLRIAQLKKQDQDKNKSQNQNQQQNQNQDKQDRPQDQNRQDQQRDQNRQDQNPPKPKEQDINPQTADQILRAVENKENQTRQRVMQGQGNSRGKNSQGNNGGRKNW